MKPSGSASAEREACLLLHQLVRKLDDKIAVIFDTGVTSRSLSYNSLHEIANLITNTLKAEAKNYEGQGFVGVGVNQCEVFPAILIGILRAGMGFYCMNHEAEFSEDLSNLQLLNIRFVIVDMDFNFPKNLAFKYLECSSTTKLYLLKMEQERCISFRPQSPSLEPEASAMYDSNDWAYAVKTSGTTSNRKLVLVSHQSIVPNVLDFADRFQLTSSDVIFGVSPATFDPHVVDVFMTLKCGGTIVYAPKSIKLRPSKFKSLFSKHGVTVLQCTPSLFYRLEEDEARRLIQANQQLRVLAFGGEPCPQKEYLRKVIPPERRGNLSVWNLYGTTELSCWAAANPVPINTPDQIGILQSLLSDTFYKIVKTDHNEEAEILLGTRERRCTVLRCEDGQIDPPVEEDGILFRRTGDTVDLEQLPFVAYKGRTDNTFKRQGHFVDLYDLEQRLASIAFVENVVCFGDFGRIYAVIVFLNNLSLEELEDRRRQLLSEIHRRVPVRSFPDHVTVVHPKDIPLTPNGKLDTKRLKQEVVEKQLKCWETCHIPYDVDDLEFMLSRAWELFGGGRPSPESQFLENGGDSLKVMQIVEYIFQELNLFGTFLQQVHSPELMKILISSTFSCLIDYVRNVILPNLKHKVSVSSFTEDSSVRTRPDLEIQPNIAGDRPELGLSFSNPEPKLELLLLPYPCYNTYGCVDSTPVLIIHPLLGTIVVGTSNSGYVIAVAVHSPKSKCSNQNTNLLWYKKFPDRLVSSVAVSPDQLTLFLVCCDCRLYAVQAENGHVFWNFFSGGLLLTPPVVVRQDLVIISADSGWVFALQQKTGLVIWKLHLDGLISSLSPHLSSSFLFLATGKEIVRIDADVGVTCSGYPLQTICTNFASCLRRKICVGSTSVETGINYINVFSFELDKMEELWKIDTDEPINHPVLQAIPNTNTIGVFYVTKRGRTRVHDLENGIVHSEVDLGTPVASTPTFLPPKGERNHTLIAIISKDSDYAGIVQIFFIKLITDGESGEARPALELKDVSKLTFPDTSPILTNILYDGNHLILGRRDDRIYFINSLNWE